MITINIRHFQVGQSITNPSKWEFPTLKTWILFWKLNTLNCQMWRRCSIDVHDSPCRRKILAIGTIPKPFGRGNRLRRRRPWKSKTYYCLYRKAYKLAFFGRFVDPLNRDFRKDETFARQGLKSKVLVANPRPSGHRNRRWSKSGLGILCLSWKS